MATQGNGGAGALDEAARYRRHRNLFLVVIIEILVCGVAVLWAKQVHREATLIIVAFGGWMTGMATLALIYEIAWRRRAGR